MILLISLLSSTSACRDPEKQGDNVRDAARIAAAMQRVEAVQARADAARRHAVAADGDRALPPGPPPGNASSDATR